METSGPEASQSPQCVEEEYTIHVPLVRPQKGFQDILRLAGATGEIFTKKEICHYLKDYISSRKLYDVTDPRVVHCGSDPLGQVFGVKRFTIDEVLNLLAKNCVELPDRCIRRKRRLVNRPCAAHLSSNLPPGSVTIAVCHDASLCTGTVVTASSAISKEIKNKAKNAVSSSGGNCDKDSGAQLASGVGECDVTSTCTVKVSEDGASDVAKKCKRKKRSKDGSDPESSSRKRHHTEPSSSRQPSPESSRQRGTSLSITYGTDCEEDGFPWYFQVEVSDQCNEEEEDKSEVLSVQGKETITVRDSTDDLWFVDDNVESDVEFSVEYDVESDSPELTESDLSSVRSGEGLLVVCRESDVEFFADYSDSESNTDDRELSEADNWLCHECKLSNPPYQRYCDRCWKLRSDWLPNNQFMLDTDKKTSQTSVSSNLSANKTKDNCAGSENQTPKINQTIDSGFGSLSSTQPSSQETVISDVTLPVSKMLGLPTLSDVSRSQESLIEESSEKRYSFSSIQLAGESRSVSQTLVEEDVNQNVKAAGHPLDDPCMICLTKPKTASLIHGSSGHQVCCFTCAKRLKRRGKVCPVCRRPIQKVVKNYIL